MVYSAHTTHSFAGLCSRQDRLLSRQDEGAILPLSFYGMLARENYLIHRIAMSEDYWSNLN